MGADIESIISEFEWSCMTDYVTDAEKAGSVVLSMDPKSSQSSTGNSTRQKNELRQAKASSTEKLCH